MGSGVVPRVGSGVGLVDDSVTANTNQPVTKSAIIDDQGICDYVVIHKFHRERDAMKEWLDKSVFFERLS